VHRLFLVASFTCCLVAQKQPPGTILEGDKGLKLDSVIASKASGYWGAVLVAVEGKIVLAKGYGMADRFKLLNSPQTLFDLGGASQQLTLLCALRLCADKKLRLEDPVGKLVADWPADKSGITLDDLVRHVSGLPPEAAWQKGPVTNNRVALQTIAATALAQRTGRVVAYSPVNSNLLALVLEETTKSRLEKLLSDSVAKPFGMSTAVLCTARPDSKLVSSRRTPQNERGEPATSFELNWAHRGARGVLASVLDVHALLRGLLSGSLLSEELLQVLWRPLPGGPGYEVSELPGNGETLVRVAGETVGYRAVWIVNRRTKSWIVMLSEDWGSLQDLQQALLAEWNQLLPRAGAPAAANGTPAPGTAPAPGTPAAAPTAEGAFSAAEAERFAGTFVLPRGGGTFVIERHAGGLRLSGWGLQASVRVGQGYWPPPKEELFRHHEDRGLRLVEQLLADAATVDGEAFTAPSSGAAARDLLRAWKKENGAPSSIEFVGSAMLQAGESWYRLRTATKQLVLHMVWAHETKWRSCEVATEPPFSVFLTSVRPDCAIAETAERRRLVLTIEGTAANRCLVFEDTSDKGGLFECRLADGKQR
jgi:CubicO group peptidase (beta-lactamase class C family)